MAGILRKFAGAFVVLDNADAEAKGSADLDEITRGAPDLLAQLHSGDAGAENQADANSGTGSGSAMGMTAEQVFQLANLPDGPNASPRLLKVIAGLTMFPREQQLMMIRAMDSADDSWTEQGVLEDAAARHETLQRHLQVIVAERNAGAQAIDVEVQRTQQSGKAVLDEIDREIASLYARREKEAAETATTLARLDAQKQELFRQDERARQGIQQVLQALGGLIAFFGAAPPAPVPPAAPRHRS